jgi:type VI secretion system protein VasG
MTIPRQALFGKLSTTLFRGVESATTLCKLRGNSHVELTHWMHQLLQHPDGDIQRIARHAEIEREVLERDLSRALVALPTGASSISSFSHHLELAIERAWVIATLAFSDRRVRGAWLMAALTSTPELRRVLLSISASFSRIPSDMPLDTWLTWVSGSPEADEPPYDKTDLSQPASPKIFDAARPATGMAALDQYCIDLTERARAAEIDPVIGRQVEIRTMMDVLLRRRQNNPLLTGEAGVGKTAVIEGLALAIAERNVPPALSEVRLLSLDIGTLLAGASMKGEFEARLKSVLESAAKSVKPVILFVDEVHTLIGAGGRTGTGDAANLLKPALARGTVRVIGATTWSEYKRYIEKDPALTRRFQVLQIAEPEEPMAVDMVRGLVSTFSDHHGVVIRDEAVRAAVSLSHRYIPSRQLPDKAISLLDTACARVALSQHAPPRELQDIRQRLQAAHIELQLLEQEARFGLDVGRTVAAAQSHIAALQAEEVRMSARWDAQREAAEALITARRSIEGEATPNSERLALAATPFGELQSLEATLKKHQGDTALVQAEVNESVIAEIVSDWTGIPVGRMVKDEVAAVQVLPQTIASRVIGQDDALKLICERVQTARANLADPRKPLGVFLLAGPSGVGKTETALALAEALYGGEQNLITVNMSEYQEAHTVSSLKGAPPGYVGYGEGGVLTEAVRRRPYSVVLLDEIEKAHHDVHEVFFQVFDKGYMEDGEGRYIDFRHTTILLTSNAGSDLISTLCLDLLLAPDQNGLRAALTPELLKTFPAAFLGRVTLVPFRPLAADALGRIVALHLNRVVRRMEDTHGMTLTFAAELVDYIVAHCLVQQTGARVLIGFIEQYVLPRLAALWLDSFARKGPIASIHIGVTAPDCAPADAIEFNVVHAVTDMLA